MRTQCKYKLRAIALWTFMFFIASGGTLYANSFQGDILKIVVPNAPGGGTDAVARVFAKALEPILGATVIVENRAGASGRIGAGYVANSPPDGKTIGFGLSAFLVIPILDPVGTPYDPEKDLTPVAIPYRFDLVLQVSRSSNVKTMKDLVARLQSYTAAPAPVGSGGIGTGPHLAAVMLGRATNSRIEPVQYAGSAPAQVDTIANRLVFNFQSIQASAENIKAGKLGAVAVLASQRSRYLPEVPTMAEAGLPQMMNLDWSQWAGFFAPAKTPQPILIELHAAMMKAMADPALRRTMSNISADLMPEMTLDQTREYFHAQIREWRPVLKSMNIQLKE